MLVQVVYLFANLGHVSALEILDLVLDPCGTLNIDNWMVILGLMNIITVLRYINGLKMGMVVFIDCIAVGMKYFQDLWLEEMFVWRG